jgi:hypothetical protein
MPSHQSYVSTIGAYDKAIDDIVARVQQDRTLHMHDLTTTYMHAIQSRMPSNYLSMLESTIGERSTFNNRKLVLDAADLTMQEAKVKHAMGSNFTALAGGSLGDKSHNALKRLHYSAKRSNALFSTFNQKLGHDRQTHLQELKMLVDATPSNTSTKQLLSELYANRLQNNDKRLRHDARAWANVDRTVYGLLGGGINARSVLSHGLSKTLSGGNVDTNLHDAVKKAHFFFESPDAARLSRYGTA